MSTLIEDLLKLAKFSRAPLHRKDVDLSGWYERSWSG